MLSEVGADKTSREWVCRWLGVASHLFQIIYLFQSVRKH